VELPRNLGANHSPLRFRIKLGESLTAGNTILQLRSSAERTRAFVLECPYWMDGFHIHSSSECGGKNKIEIGDAIRFRVEKNHASLLTPEGKEQKLGVVSEGMKEAGNTVPATSQEP
jgi:hypothetical protein